MTGIKEETWKFLNKTFLTQKFLHIFLWPGKKWQTKQYGINFTYFIHIFHYNYLFDLISYTGIETWIIYRPVKTKSTLKDSEGGGGWREGVWTNRSITFNPPQRPNQPSGAQIQLPSKGLRWRENGQLLLIALFFMQILIYCFDKRVLGFQAKIKHWSS